MGAVAGPWFRDFTALLSEGAPRPWLRPLHTRLTPPRGALIRTLDGHSAGVNAVALSPDGRRAVSASEDSTLKLWDLETGAIVATFTCDSSAACCSFAGAHRIVAGESGGRVHFLSLELARED